ncbi:hypothetical protein GZH47_33160 (plasmid) [Paenibacillus rhizovicinus]|uniref:Uncharacterized protein n=1 Tax=Paenibacillus rhizovicinus TaxID=2704463 RepID=A0A6C0PAZ1_9BACL|nr:hypothetical protein [Paenibacillus rhizovicinus]QHW35744.1 hypothetical protein GZH47_33160 [Paenibacillus rhizovicinus]
MSSSNPTASLSRFLYAIFDYHQDKGLPVPVAKAKMYDDSFETLFKLMKQEKGIPDHMLAIAAQFMSRTLNLRGSQLAKQAQDLQKDDPQVQVILKAMQDIKLVKDAVDIFISSYKGTTSS